MDVEVFHFCQEFGDVTVVFEKAHLGKGLVGLMGRAKSSPRLFCNDMRVLVSRLPGITLFSSHLPPVC